MVDFAKETSKLSKLSLYLDYSEEQKLSQIAEHLNMEKAQVVKKALHHFIVNNPNGDNGKNYNLLFDNSNINTINNESFKFKKVVELIVNKVSETLDAEMAGVMLYDENRKELVLQKPAFGLDNEAEIDAYSVPLSGDGNAVQVFLTGIPSISNDTPSDPRFLKHFVLKYGARNTITVPLEINSRRIGVLHVNNKKEGCFSQKDVELLNLLSSHLALLLENTAYYEKEKQQSELLRKMNQDLNNQQKRLRKLMDIHGKLIQRVLYEEGLNAVTTTLGELLNCKVTVEDKHFNVISSNFSKNDNYELRPNEYLKNIKTLPAIEEKLYTAQSNKQIQFIPACYNEGIDYFRILVPLKDKNSTLGYLSLLLKEDSFTQLNELDSIAIEQAALVASLELVKEKNAYEIEAALKGEFLDLLIRGEFNSEQELIERARFLNYDISGPQSIIIMRIQKQNKENLDPSLTTQKQINFLIFLIKQHFFKHILLPRGNEIIILTKECEREAIVKRLEKICSEFKNKYTVLHATAGIGQPCYDISKINGSFQQAKKVVEIINLNSFFGDVVSYEDLGIYNLIFNINDQQALNHFIKEKIGSIIEFDKTKKNSLLQTLESYLNNGCSTKKASKELFVHIKTMEYRLKKIKDILEISELDANTCLELNMAIKIYRFQNKL